MAATFLLVLTKSAMCFCVRCLQGVHLDDGIAPAASHCQCSGDTDPVCARCGGTRQLNTTRRHPIASVASLGVVASTATESDELVLQASPTSLKDVFDTPPSSATVPHDDDEDAADEAARCFQRLHSASEITSAGPYHHHHQQRSFSTVTTGSFLPDPTADVGGVSVRSAPDSAFLVRQPEVVPGHGGQRSKLQRFFEPLKRSKSAGGNQKDTILAAQASLYDPTRQQIPVENNLLS